MFKFVLIVALYYPAPYRDPPYTMTVFNFEFKAISSEKLSRDLCLYTLEDIKSTFSATFAGGKCLEVPDDHPKKED